MKKIFYISICLLLATTFKIQAQGCVAVRQMGGNSICSSSGYNLKKGEFQIGGTYRYFHSFRHFVGTDEKEFRQTTQGGFDYNGKQKGNAVNIFSQAIDKLHGSIHIDSEIGRGTTVMFEVPEIDS